MKTSAIFAVVGAIGILVIAGTVAAAGTSAQSGAQSAGDCDGDMHKWMYQKGSQYQYNQSSTDCPADHDYDYNYSWYHNYDGARGFCPRT